MGGLFATIARLKLQMGWTGELFKFIVPMKIIGKCNPCAASIPITCARSPRSWRRAASRARPGRLNLAQPTISLQIRELETRLGVRLVDRLGKRAFATAAGRELIEHAQRIAQETDRLLGAMRRHRDGWLGQVRIGSSTTALIYHLPPVLARLRKEHPNIELVVTTGTTTGVVERMLKKRDRSRRRQPAHSRAPAGARAAEDGADARHLLRPHGEPAGKGHAAVSAAAAP